MTDGNPRPDQEPTPPTSTRWSDEAEAASDDHDEGLAPPFVPGGAPEPVTEPAAPEPTAPEPAAAEPAAAEPGTTEPTPSEPAPSEPPEPEEEPFPFESGWDEEEEQGETLAAEAEDDFPFEDFDIEGGEGEGEEEAGPYDSAMAVEPTEPAEPTEPVEPVQRSPWDVGAGTTPTADEETPDDVREPSEAAGAVEQSAAAELADRLEEMAARLRDRGVEAAEEQMSAPDRFTALLAGLLAGYLSGRE
ncbi:MAG: hypothetical protein R6U63_15785 [Longimicrobiales bacterium]